MLSPIHIWDYFRAVHPQKSIKVVHRWSNKLLPRDKKLSGKGFFPIHTWEKLKRGAGETNPGLKSSEVKKAYVLWIWPGTPYKGQQSNKRVSCKW